MSYAYKRTITIDHLKVPNTDLTNFPMLFAGTYTYLKTAANGGQVQSASGYDIVFTSDSVGSNLLKFERVAWSAASGACEFWIKIPTLSHESDTVIYLWYGNAGVTEDQQDAVNAWSSDFRVVYHLQALSGPFAGIYRFHESTGRIADEASDTTAVVADGKIGKGLSFDGTVTAVAGNIYAASAIGPTKAFSVEGWFNTSDSSGETVSPSPYVWTDEFLPIVQIWKPSGSLAIAACGYKIGTSGITTVPQNVSTGVWYHYVGTFLNGAVNLFLNGSKVGEPVSYDATVLGAAAASVGGWYLTGYWRDWVAYGKAIAVVDELRVYDMTPSDDWIATSYNSQNDPSTFYTVSAATGGVTQFEPGSVIYRPVRYGSSLGGFGAGATRRIR